MNSPVWLAIAGSATDCMKGAHEGEARVPPLQYLQVAVDGQRVLVVEVRRVAVRRLLRAHLVDRAACRQAKQTRWRPQPLINQFVRVQVGIFGIAEGLADAVLNDMLELLHAVRVDLVPALLSTDKPTNPSAIKQWVAAARPQAHAHEHHENGARADLESDDFARAISSRWGRHRSNKDKSATNTEIAAHWHFDSSTPGHSHRSVCGL